MKELIEKINELKKNSPCLSYAKALSDVIWIIKESQQVKDKPDGKGWKLNSWLGIAVCPECCNDIELDDKLMWICTSEGCIYSLFKHDLHEVAFDTFHDGGLTNIQPNGDLK